MKETGILFKPGLIRKILADEKTETRRVIKPQPWKDTASMRSGITGHWQAFNKDEWNIGYGCRCRYGKAGDRLWIKEAWGHDEALSEGIQYKLDWPEEEIEHATYTEWKWKNPMFMPRKVSRIDLDILNIKAERIQWITPESAKAEGVRNSHFHQKPDWLDVDQFIQLWNEINAKPKLIHKTIKGKKVKSHYVSYPWSIEYMDRRQTINGLPHKCIWNPWVWAIKFKRIK